MTNHTKKSKIINKMLFVELCCPDTQQIKKFYYHHAKLKMRISQQKLQKECCHQMSYIYFLDFQNIGAFLKLSSKL